MVSGGSGKDRKIGSEEEQKSGKDREGVKLGPENMKVPVSYSFRNLWTRRLTTILTAGGMALVVFVFAAILMLAEGLQKTLVDTGSFDNVIVIRKSSASEV